MRRLAPAIIAALLIGLLSAAPASAQESGNDAFGDATPVTAIPFDDVVPVGLATIEEGEPTETCAPFANTVWYDVTLDSDTDLVVDTAGSNYDTAVAVWVGDSFDELSIIACNDDTFQGLQAAAPFSAVAGETYHVQIGAFGGASPDATLNVSIDEPGRSTGRPFISKFSSRGVSAEAFVEEFDEETGTFSFTSVFVSQGREKAFEGRPFQSSFLGVSHFEETFDPETGEFTFVDVFGSTELSPDQFDVDRQLRSGFVDAEVVLAGVRCTEGFPEETEEGFEFDTNCEEIGPDLAAVDVTWTGQGPTFQSRFTDRFSTDGFRSSFRGRSTSRDAQVSGSVEGETIFFDLNSAFGSLSRNTNAEMVVVRGGAIFF